MQKNVGRIDRTIRISAALLIGILYLTGQLPGTIAGILGIAAILFLVTGLFSFCPLYGACRISTQHSTKEINEGVSKS